MRSLLAQLPRQENRAFLETAQKRMKKSRALMRERASSDHTPICPQVVSWHLPELLDEDAILGAMLQFAVGRRLIPANAAKGAQLLKSAQKARFLSEAEVARLADTLAAMENERKLSSTAAAVRLLLLTGCWKSEILSLCADSDDVARLFRDHVARCSDMMSPA